MAHSLGVGQGEIELVIDGFTLQTEFIVWVREPTERLASLEIRDWDIGRIYIPNDIGNQFIDVTDKLNPYTKEKFEAGVRDELHQSLDHIELRWEELEADDAG